MICKSPDDEGGDDDVSGSVFDDEGGAPEGGQEGWVDLKNLISMVKIVV